MNPLKNRSNPRPMAASAAVLALLMLAGCGASTSSPTADSDSSSQTDAPEDASETTAPADGGDDEGSATDGYDLCEAVTEDEVSEITGAEVTDSTFADLDGVLSCNYNTVDTAVAGTTLATSASGIDPRSMYDAYRDAEGVEEISGLGDGAVMTGDEDFPILMVLANGNLYSLSVLADNLDGPGKREATIEMARRSIDRLP